MTEPVANVMLVDDHAVVRAGYRILLELHPAFTVIAEVQTGEEAVDQYSRSAPDVVVMDLNLPGISGMEATRRILQRDPDAKILIFSIHDEPIYVSRALDAGACGYLCKSCSPQEMIEAVRVVASGKPYTGAHPVIAAHRNVRPYHDPMRALSAREFEIFQLMGKGCDSKEIADLLQVTSKTVSNYAVLIKEKLSLNSNTELVSVATQFMVTRGRSL